VHVPDSGLKHPSRDQSTRPDALLDRASSEAPALRVVGKEVEPNCQLLVQPSPQESRECDWLEIELLPV